MRFRQPQRGATALPTPATSRLPVPSLRRAAVLSLAGIPLLAALVYLVTPDPERAARTGDPAALRVSTNAKAPPAEPASAPASTEASPAPTEPPWSEQTVRSGDNLSLIFKRAGYTDRDLHDVVNGAGDGKALARIYPGQVIAFQADDSGRLAAVRHVRSALESVVYRRTGQGFESELEARTPEVRETWTVGVIESSLFLAGQQAGLSHNTIMQLANIFGGVIDFVLDPREGDTIHVIYEDLYLDGEKYADGEIIAASFTNQGRTFSAYRYEDSNGETGYYNEQGESMRKPFLLAPVDFTRISSNFNLRRLHPIYKTTRPHRGTDYAAPRGTPVFAAGDGRVTEAGYSNANGNYVFIKHGEEYVTKYLHLHKRQVGKGQRVQQSQVIGTVGSTGAATGPHLHYEFLVNGVHRDPRTVHKQLPKAKTLPAHELDRFLASIGKASNQLASIGSDNQLAMSESVEADTAHN